MPELRSPYPWEEEETGPIYRNPTTYENVRNTAVDLSLIGSIIDKIRTGEYSSSPYRSALEDISQLGGQLLDSPALAAMKGLPLAGKALMPFLMGQIKGSLLKNIWWPDRKMIPTDLVPKQWPQNLDEVKRVLTEAITEGMKFTSNAEEKGNQAIATVRRTMPALREIMTNRKRAATKEMLEPFGMRSWFLDMPTRPIGRQPLVVRAHGDLQDTLRTMGYMNPSDSLNGIYFHQPKNIVAFEKSKHYDTLPHEMFHWARRLAKEMGILPGLDEQFEMITKQNPKLDAYYRQIPSYTNYTPVEMGEEIVAKQAPWERLTDDTWELVRNEYGDLIDRLVDAARRQVKPEMRVNAWEYPAAPIKKEPLSHNKWMFKEF